MGDFQFLAGPGHAVDDLRELPHDVRLFGIAEIQAVRRADRNRAGTSHIARSFCHRVHGAQARIEVTPASVAVERHGQAALRTAGPS